LWRRKAVKTNHYFVLQKAWSPHRNWNCEPIEARSEWQSWLKAGRTLPNFTHCLKFLEEVHKAMKAISTSQWFCAQKFVQISTSQQFCGRKILQRASCAILSMKNPTNFFYLTICPPENINNGKLVSTTYTDLKLRQ
jgi:hypothetical protein